MKDLLAIVDAVHRSKELIANHLEGREPDPEVTLARIIGVLESRDLEAALDAVCPKIIAPRISPDPLPEGEKASPVR
jgi:hypothetical protein